MKLSVGVILSHGFPVPSPFVIGFSGLLQELMTGSGNAVTDEKIDATRIIFTHMFPTDVARNELCQKFLDNDGGDALLFLDADMVHPQQMAHRLVHTGKDVVTARYQIRREPFFTCAMRKVGDGSTEYNALEKVMDFSEIKGLLPIDAAGAGALLVRRHVLEDIRERNGDEWFRYQDSAAGKRTRSEDMWFFEQARACGYQPWLDASQECRHVGQFEIDKRWHVPFYEVMQKLKTQETVEGVPV